MDNNETWWILPLAASPWPVQLLVALVFITAAAALAWRLVIWQNRSTGRKSNDYWNAMQTSPIAVAIYRTGVFATLFGFVAYLVEALVRG